MQIPGLHHLSAEMLADTITETTGRKGCNSKTKNVDVVWHVVPMGCMCIYRVAQKNVYTLYSSTSLE